MSEYFKALFIWIILHLHDSCFFTHCFPWLDCAIKFHLLPLKWVDTEVEFCSTPRKQSCFLRCVTIFNTEPATVNSLLMIAASAVKVTREIRERIRPLTQSSRANILDQGNMSRLISGTLNAAKYVCWMFQFCLTLYSFRVTRNVIEHLCSKLLSFCSSYKPLFPPLPSCVGKPKVTTSLLENNDTGGIRNVTK